MYAPLYQVGKTYAVQPGRGKKAVARIRITSIRYQEHPHDITPEDIRAEGYADFHAFLSDLVAVNGTPRAGVEPVWVLDFELVDRIAPAPEASRA